MNLQIIKYLAVIGIVLGIGRKVYDAGSDAKDAEWKTKWHDEQARITAVNLEHEKKVRQLQTDLQSTADRVNKDAKVKVDVLQRSLIDAGTAYDRLHNTAMQYAASAKECSADTGIANLRTDATSPARVLAVLLSKSDQRSGILAKRADELTIALEACNEWADGVKMILPKGLID